MPVAGEERRDSSFFSSPSGAGSRCRSSENSESGKGKTSNRRLKRNVCVCLCVSGTQKRGTVKTEEGGYTFVCQGL